MAAVSRLLATATKARWYPRRADNFILGPVISCLSGFWRPRRPHTGCAAANDSSSRGPLPLPPRLVIAGTNPRPTHDVLYRGERLHVVPQLGHMLTPHRSPSSRRSTSSKGAAYRSTFRSISRMLFALPPPPSLPSRTPSSFPAVCPAPEQPVPAAVSSADLAASLVRSYPARHWLRRPI